ncbi:MAG: class I tRNA ligase family protein, partial [Patescibacteria group bacterium]
GWKIYPADFVTTETGTGIVHIAPAFGEDDMNLGKKFNLPFIQHVFMDGTFKKEVSDFAGQEVKPKDNHQKADIEIIKNLAGKNLLFGKEKIIHPYPHCWRCDSPLLNYAANSWFIEVTKLRLKLLAQNKKVKWVPEAIGKGRFHNWLSGARDWAVSRARFWGAPLPVWKCGSCKEKRIIGSLEELKKLSKKSGNKYILMRHGQAEHNVLDMISCDKNNSHHLTEIGKRQVIKTINALKKKKIDFIASSPFTRTKETALIIKDLLGLPESQVIFDARLAEANFGDFNGKKPADYHNYFSSFSEQFKKRAPNGENLTDLKKRMMNFLEEIDGKYADKNILIITHEYPAWMIYTGVSGANIETSVSMKEKKGEFLKNAEMVDLPFSQFPHNNDYELDFHRPYVDKIILACSCGADMRRISDVFDCWFESGGMPYAQFHYPFENKKEFKKNFPADFIAEGVDQTRGWFYSSMVLGVGLFGKSPFKNVVVNGMILAEDGQKMSKRLKNYPDPMGIVSKYGADALRFTLLSMPTVKGEDASFSERAVDEINKKLIVRLQNIFSFYEMYGMENTKSTANGNILDKWILARLAETKNEVSSGFDNYEFDRAMKPIAEFIDDMSTWYIRRSRERFKSDDFKDRESAMATTRFTLLELSKIIAPAMPFLSEDIYLKLGGVKESVHLENWPKPRRLNREEKVLIKDMETCRKIVSIALEKRAE